MGKEVLKVFCWGERLWKWELFGHIILIIDKSLLFPHMNKTLCMFSKVKKNYDIYDICEW